MAKVIVTGGAGFIGCNAASRFIERGDAVVVVDNLSRQGGEANLKWLRSIGPFEFLKADIRDARAVDDFFAKHADADTVLHLAGQVAVTSSVANPREDFEVNALGSLNVLEAVRKTGARPLMIYSSTNKVYGGLKEVAVEEGATRYTYRDFREGIPETTPLDFETPYGCSKGCADQYFRDYARMYGIPTAVFRQSCIYGPRQFGVEDQGWVAWFVIAAILNRPITIYGNGKQVRDLLYIDDLVQAFVLAVENRDAMAGEIFNVGGGPGLTVAVWAEFGPLLEKLLGHAIPVRYDGWRRGDQPIYISNIRKIRERLGWEPMVSVAEGTRRLVDWVKANRALFSC